MRPVRWEMAAAVRRGGLRVVRGDLAASPYPKCSLFLRAGARAVDVALAAALYRLFWRTGAVVPLLFLLFADGLFQGQSVGKRLFGIRAVYVPTRAGARHRDSVLRNAPFALVVLLGMMPHPLGRAAFLAGALIIGGIEGLKVLRDPLGLRLGDVWAQTQVVDGKVVDGHVVGGKVVASESPLGPTRVTTPGPGRWRVAGPDPVGRAVPSCGRRRTRCESR